MRHIKSCNRKSGLIRRQTCYLMMLDSNCSKFESRFISTHRKTGHIAVANHAWLHLLHLGMALYSLLLAGVDTRLGGYP